MGNSPTLAVLLLIAVAFVCWLGFCAAVLALARAALAAAEALTVTAERTRVWLATVALYIAALLGQLNAPAGGR